MRQPAAGLAERQPRVVDIGAEGRVVVGCGQQVVAEADDGVAGVVGAQHRAANASVRSREVQLGIGHQGELVGVEGPDQPPHVEQVGVAAAAARLAVAEQRQVGGAGMPSGRLGMGQDRVRALRIRPVVIARTVGHLVGEAAVVLRDQVAHGANDFRCGGAVDIVDDDVAVLPQPGPVETAFHRFHTRRNDMTIRRHPFLHSENPTGIRTRDAGRSRPGSS